MLFSFTGTNTLFLEQSFFDPDGGLSVELTSVTPSEFVYTHTLYTQANVFVTFKGFGFVTDNSDNFISGQITSIEFNGLNLQQAAISGINWSAPAVQNALEDIAQSDDFTAIAALFSSSGPITIDASDALRGYNQEIAWAPILPLLTQPITFIGSQFDDDVRGTARDDTIQTGGSSQDGDRIIASQGDDLIVFDLPEGGDSAGFIVDYGTLTDPIDVFVDGVRNTGRVEALDFTDGFENVNEAMATYLGIEGSAGADTFTARLAPNQIFAMIGGPGSDSYDIEATDAVPILDFLFSNVSSGITLNFDTGIVANDGFGFAETFDISGTPRNTVLLATNRNDVITDGPGNQLVRTFDGNDTVFAHNLGNDSVSGGAGEDTVVFSDVSQGQATITISGGVSTFVDRSAPEGSTALLSVENIETQGGVLFQLDRHDGIGQISAQDLVTLTELYIAYFNRAADALGLSFWATAFQDNGFSLREIAELFFDQPETKAIYDGTTNGEFVNAVYSNVFGRLADLPGFNFWTNQLDLGNVTRAEFIVDFLAGARADTGSPQDVTFIETKTDIGLYFAVVQGQSNVADARDVMDAYNGSISSIFNAIGLADEYLADAQASDTELLLPVLGIIDDPFSAAV